MKEKGTWFHVINISALMVGWMIVDAIKGDTIEFEHMYMLAVGYISCALTPWVERKIGGVPADE